MGPDSFASSLAMTPLRSDSQHCIVINDKSTTSSISSESKTLTIETDFVKRQTIVDTNNSGEKSVTPLTDSLMQVKSIEAHCSSTESLCSPNKIKSDRSFSSDLQSPISANSIKFSSGYGYKNPEMDLQKPPMGNIMFLIN